MRFTHVVACGCGTFSLLYRSPFVWLYHNQCSYSLIDGHFELFPDFGHDHSWSYILVRLCINIWKVYTTCGMLDHWVYVSSVSMSKAKPFSPTDTLSLVYESSCDFHPLQHLALSNFLIFVYPVGEWCYFLAVLIFISLMKLNNFSYISWALGYLLLGCSCPGPFLILSAFFWLSCKSFYIFWFLLLFQLHVLKYLFQ